MNSLVILPTYNEAETIATLINRIFKHISRVEILVVDGGSKDGTVEIVKELQKHKPQLHLLEEERKSGLGKAYLTGFAWGLARDYATIVEMDADLSHRVRDLAKLLEIENADLVIGSRWISGGKIENWSRIRELLSRSANKYVQFMLRLDVEDATSGLRAYRADFLRRFDLNSIRSEGYGFQIEMTQAARKLNARIAEVPIVFREREFGKSKISRAIVLEAMLRVTYWGLKRIGGGGGI
jgi:dolichol-phosphate mannosyltransferase